MDRDEKIRLGGYVLALFKGLDAWDTDMPAFDDFEATLITGKASDLISALRALGTIEAAEFEIRRKLARLRRRDVSVVMNALVNAGLVEVEWNEVDGAHEIHEIRTVIHDRSTVLMAAAAVFEDTSPTVTERIAVEILDSTSRIPQSYEGTISLLTGLGFEEGDVRHCLKSLLSFQLVATTIETEAGQPLIYNPQVFTDTTVDAFKVIEALGNTEKQAALHILDHVHRRPGVPMPRDCDKRIALLLAKVGIIDMSAIKVRGGATQKEFPTAPQIWGRFAATGLSEDLVDDSKLLLNSFRYGEFYSPASRGQIHDPLVLVSRLIDRGQVGAATAIGEDYPMALARGIVSITESRMSPGRYFMELRKRDVAEAVRDVLDQGAIVSLAGEDAQPLPTGTEFSSPEKIRVHKKLPKELLDVRDQLAFELRTHRRQSR